MNELKVNQDQKSLLQASIAFRKLQDALTEHVGDVNMRLQAGLAVTETRTAIEVHEIEKPDVLLRLRLTRENNISYTQLIKRHRESKSGVIYIRASQNDFPAILFSAFPHPNEQVSYSEASRRLLNPCF